MIYNLIECSNSLMCLMFENITRDSEKNDEKIGNFP